MKDATSRAIVFVMVIIALIVVVNDIKRRGHQESQSNQVENQDFEKSNLAISEIDEE